MENVRKIYMDTRYERNACLYRPIHISSLQVGKTNVVELPYAV